jgi:hypothetical protein
VDTDFVFAVPKTQSAAILHHFLNVSSKTVCLLHNFLCYFMLLILPQCCFSGLLGCYADWQCYLLPSISDTFNTVFQWSVQNA